MANSIRKRTARLAWVAMLLVATGIAQAGTSSASMSVGLTLVSPDAAEAAPRRDGVINPEGAMAVQGADAKAMRAAVDAAPRTERLLADARDDGGRVLLVQF